MTGAEACDCLSTVNLLLQQHPTAGVALFEHEEGGSSSVMQMPLLEQKSQSQIEPSFALHLLVRYHYDGNVRLMAHTLITRHSVDV